MPPVLQKTIREIHQRLRALETREYAEVVGPGSVINAQYLTLALHAVLTAERRFVAGDGLVGTDAGANADYTLDIDLAAAWSGLEFAAGELRVDEDAAFTWAGAHTFNVNILLAGGVTIDGMDPSAFMVTYAAHDHSAGDPTQVDHADLVNVLANQHHAEVHVVNSTGPHAEAGLAVGNVLRASGAAAFAFAQLQHGDLGGVGANDHHAEIHVVNSTGPHAEAGLTIGHVLRVSGAAAFAFAQLQHGDLGGVAANDHHNEVHIVNSTGPHAEAGLTIGHVLRVSGAAAFSFAQLQHTDLGGVAANQHHAQIHDVVGADHTLTGAQWNLVGATALNTIGLLLPLSDVSGPAEAILKSNATGDLTVHDLTATGQLSAGAGIAEGLLLGADAQWYRSAANMLRTPDSVTIDVGLNIATTGAAAGQIKANSHIFSAASVYAAGPNGFIFGAAFGGEMIWRNGNDILIHAGGIDVLTIDGDNSRVGINRTTPEYSLHTYDGSDGSGEEIAIYCHHAGSSVGDNIAIMLRPAGGVGGAAAGAKIVATAPGGGDIELAFHVTDGGASALGMTLEDDATLTVVGCVVDGTCEIFTEDALEIIKDIHAHGSKRYDEYGHEHFNMAWIFERYPFLIHKSRHGYFDKLGAKSDLLYRAAMQLNGYILAAGVEREAIRAEIMSAKEQIGILQNRLAVLEQAA